LVFRWGTVHSFIYLTWSWASKVQSIWTRWRHVSGWRQDATRYDLLHWSRHYVEVSKITVLFLIEIKWLLNNFETYYRVYKKGLSVIIKKIFLYWAACTLPHIREVSVLSLLRMTSSIELLFMVLLSHSKHVCLLCVQICHWPAILSSFSWSYSVILNSFLCFVFKYVSDQLYWAHFHGLTQSF
jgi:hypothetical protein